MTNVTFHTSSNKVWRDASGAEVPFKFVPAVDRTKETLAQKILSKALKAEQILKDLYDFMESALNEITALVQQEYAIKKGKEKKVGKGSFTWYNFDKSVKIEADVNEVVKWDESLLSEALKLINEYLGNSLSDANELIRNLVSEAFANTKGMVDTRKIFQLIKYQDKIKSAKYQKACELLKQAQGIDKSKLYMRVWIKETDGSYRNINLNFSTL